MYVYLYLRKGGWVVTAAGQTEHGVRLQVPENSLQPGGGNTAPRPANVPELVHPGQGGNGSIPNVPGMINLPVLHLHLCVFQPERDISVVDVQGTLVNGTGSGRQRETSYVSKVPPRP